MSVQHRLQQLTAAADITTPAFRRWFGHSKIIKDGKPLIVYHGAATKFNSFDLKKAGYGQIWFSNSKSAIEQGLVGATGHGIIMSVYLSIQNPAGWSQYDDLYIDQIIEKYDGIILPGDDTTYIVFQPWQIKSVDNQGTWSRSSKDIYK
jgi:hypothetical protein